MINAEMVNVGMGIFEEYELVIMALVGVAVLLAGYRIKKMAFFIIWFLLGFALVNALMPFIVSLWPDVASNTLWPILLKIAGGVLLAMLGFTVEKFCVGGIAFALVEIITIQYFSVSLPVMVGGGIVGVLAAGLAGSLQGGRQSLWRSDGHCLGCRCPR